MTSYNYWEIGVTTSTLFIILSYCSSWCYMFVSNFKAYPFEFTVIFLFKFETINRCILHFTWCIFMSGVLVKRLNCKAISLSTRHWELVAREAECVSTRWKVPKPVQHTHLGVDGRLMDCGHQEHFCFNGKVLWCVVIIFLFLVRWTGTQWKSIANQTLINGSRVIIYHFRKYSTV